MERPQAKGEELGDKAAEVYFVTGRKRNQVGAEGKGGETSRIMGLRPSRPRPRRSHSFFLGLCWGKGKSVTDSRNYARCCRPRKRERGRQPTSMALSFSLFHRGAPASIIFPPATNPFFPLRLPGISSPDRLPAPHC